MTFIEEIVRADIVSKQEREILSSWETYTNEARWGWKLIHEDVQNLASGSKVLEVGSGSNILAAQVASTGMVVTAIEPSGQGFSIMNILGERVCQYAIHHGVVFEIRNISGEDFIEFEKFDYAYSINVMEHVSEKEKVLDNVLASLKVNATYHFICPNYGFPFEPHFNVPTFLNKYLTDSLLRNYAINRSELSDAAELWNSLNWITVRKLRKWAKGRPNVSMELSKNALNAYILRSASDGVFQDRHPRLTQFAKLVEPVLLTIAKVFPARISPFIDVKITKTN
jgi:SAM-dependent methyltransferase